MNRYRYIWASLLAIPCSALAWEFGPVANYADADKSLNVNGRYIHLKTGGLGLHVGGSFFNEHVLVNLSALGGYAGSAQASFSGADVSGPAKLSTYKANLSVQLRPDSWATPFLRWGESRQRGDTDFTGLRNGVPVRGRANLTFDTTETALGLRLRIFESFSVYGETGRQTWRLNSDASGTVGALRARTQIQASNTDPFVRLGLRIHRANWQGAVSVGRYRMTADNEIAILSVDAVVGYSF